MIGHGSHHHHHHTIRLTWCKRTALQEHVTKSELSRVLSMSKSCGEQISLHRSVE